MDARIAPPFMEATDASRLVCVVVVSHQEYSLTYSHCAFHTGVVVHHSAPTGSTLLVGSRGGLRPVCVGASPPPPSFAPSVVPPSIHTILEPPSMSPLPVPDNDLTKARGDAGPDITILVEKKLVALREDQSGKGGTLPDTRGVGGGGVVR